MIESRLPALGHRNWVLVVDSAYPEQVGAIETHVSDQLHEEVLREVVSLLKSQPHVRPVALLDRELDFINDDDLPGVDDLKRSMHATLTDIEVESRPHDEILQTLAEAAKTYAIVAIKTPSRIPYTSVFFRLECGYWNDEQERALRARMQA